MLVLILLVLLIAIFLVNLDFLYGLSGGDVRKMTVGKPNKVFSNILLNKDCVYFRIKLAIISILFLLFFVLDSNLTLLLSYVLLIGVYYLILYLFRNKYRNLIPKYTLILVNFISYFLVPYANLIYYLKKSKIAKKTVDMEEEILSIVEGEAETINPHYERKMIQKVFRLDDILVKQIMIPRTKILAFGIDTPKTKLEEAFRNSKVNRIPIYEQTLDKIVGIIYAKDLIGLKESDYNLKNLMRKPIFVKETLTVYEAFKILRDKQRTTAIVTDKYGGVEGLCSLAHVISQIFGDIQFN